MTNTPTSELYTPQEAYAEIRSCITDYLDISVNTNFVTIDTILTKKDINTIDFIQTVIVGSIRDPMYEGKIDELVGVVPIRDETVSLQRGYTKITREIVHVLWSN